MTKKPNPSRPESVLKTSALTAQYTPQKTESRHEKTRQPKPVGGNKYEPILHYHCHIHVQWGSIVPIFSTQRFKTCTRSLWSCSRRRGITLVTFKSVLVFVEAEQANPKDQQKWDNKSYKNTRWCIRKLGGKTGEELKLHLPIFMGV